VGVLSFALTQKKEPKKKSRLQSKFPQNYGSHRCENELAPPSAGLKQHFRHRSARLVLMGISLMPREQPIQVAATAYTS
jgi:hypothetical protein